MRPLHVSRRNSTFQILQALKHNRAKRNELREVFVEGIAPIKSACAAGRVVKRLIYQSDMPLSGWARALLASSTEAQVIALDGELFRELTDKAEPCELFATFERENLHLDQCEVRDGSLHVVVDRPSNHGNLGSIIRTADAFGVHLVVTLGHGVDVYDPAVIRASMGAIFHTPVCHEESTRALAAWIAREKSRHPHVSVIGTDSAAADVLSAATPPRGAVIVMIGNEAKGLSVQLTAMADRLVKIPMQGSVDSLNVACAASIVMYELSQSMRGGNDATAQ